MKYVRFYLEFPDRKTKKQSGKTHKGHSGNVTALFENRVEGLGGVYDYPNSPVACTSVSETYMDNCKRIPEALARKIHPALFERLDVETKGGQ